MVWNPRHVGETTGPSKQPGVITKTNTCGRWLVMTDPVGAIPTDRSMGHPSLPRHPRQGVPGERLISGPPLGLCRRLTSPSLPARGGGPHERWPDPWLFTVATGPHELLVLALALRKVVRTAKMILFPEKQQLDRG